jgi:thiol-disulfide isomerase/thioredoxin
MSNKSLAIALPLVIGASFLANENAQSADRVVLAENFTATWCGYCPSVSSGLIQVIDQNPDNIVGFQVHGSDDYTCSWGNSRLSFYGVSGFPTVYLDGWWSQVGSYGSISGNASNISNGMNACLNRPTDVVISAVGQEITGSQYKITWDVGVEAGGTAKSVRFYAVQALDVWPASGSHYFNCVIQHQNETVLSLTPGSTQTIEQTFNLSGTSLSNKDNVKYIAWAQDVVGSGPAQIHNVEYHEHGQLAPEIVSVGGPGSDYPTITEAIDSIGSMSTITVNPGTYYENIDLQGKNIKLIASGSPEETILDGGGFGRVLSLLDGQDSNTEINGFTITNGVFSLGAGLSCNGTPIIKNCIIGNNSSNYVIAGLMSSGPTGPTLENVQFCNNTVAADNDMHVWGNYVDGGQITFEDECDIITPCDGDYDDNSEVNVNDLLAVIAGWQSSYDVNDLLNVIANWGADCG